MSEDSTQPSSAQSGFLAQPMGFPGIIAFSVYFVVVAVLAIFCLFGFWPSEEAWTTIYIPFMENIELSGSGRKASEPRLIVLAVISGAMGAFVHAATSFSTYLGNRSLKRCWAIWYLLRPFIGVALAVIVYFLLIGGFLSAEASAKEISPYGVCAISGLAGMFSKQAVDKLHEIFDTIFPSEESKKRQDKLVEETTDE
jgi:hypothetical protein